MFCTPVLLCLEKCRVFFNQSSTKHAQVPKKHWGITKERVGCLPHLECTSEKTVENFWVQAQIFRLTVRKKNLILGEKRKRHPNVLCTQKNEKLSCFLENFSQRLKDFRPKKKMKKHFFWEKIPNSSSVHLFSFSEIRTGVFFPKNWHKKLKFQTKKLRNQEKTSTLSSPSWLHLRKHCWKHFCQTVNI